MKKLNLYLTPAVYAEVAKVIQSADKSRERFVPTSMNNAYIDMDGTTLHCVEAKLSEVRQETQQHYPDTAVKPVRSRPLEMRQVAGKHYSDMSIEPIDYIMANDMCYNSGSVLKYISRFRRKNGLEDLYKAQAFLAFLISDVEKNPKKYGLDPSKTESQSEEYRTR